jgi:guanylate kinase
MNQLKHIEEFRLALADYTLSENAKKTLASLDLVLMVGPTSSGRNTIIRELVKTGAYHFIVSDTTREPRANDGVLEQNGREYWFRSEHKMLQEIRDGDFLEAAIIHNQQVSGISIRELEEARQSNKIAMTEVEIVGANNTYNAKPDTKIIFSVPPGFEEWMKRLRRRGKLPESEIRRRLETACLEFDAALIHDYYRFVINDDVDETVAVVDSMARLDHRDDYKEAVARDLVKDLYQQTRDYLAKSA